MSVNILNKSQKSQHIEYVSTLYQHIFVITTILNEIRNLLGVNGHCTKHMYVGFLTRVARRQLLLE
jgi:hypothetical protein